MFRRGEGEDRHDQHDRRDHQGPIQPSEVQVRDSQGGAGSEVTVVGKGARIEGNLISAGSLRIDGQVKGKITAEGDVSLSPQSEVQALSGRGLLDHVGVPVELIADGGPDEIGPIRVESLLDHQVDMAKVDEAEIDRDLLGFAPF